MQYIHCLRIRSWSRDLNTNFTIKYCFLGAVKFTKYADRDKHSYSGYRTGSDSHSLFFFNFNWGKNAIIFRVDNSSSVHI